MMTHSSQYEWVVPNEIAPCRPFSINDTIQQYFQLFDNIKHYTLSPSSSRNWLGVLSLMNPLSAALNISLVNMMLTDEHVLDEGVEVLGFIDMSRQDQSFSDIAENSCPGMMELMTTILLAVHEDPEKIASMTLPAPAFPSFHGEFFASRPKIFLSYLTWLQPIMRLLQTESLLSNITAILSTTPACMVDFPSLFASYYFKSNMARIVTNKKYTHRLDKRNEEIAFHNFMDDFNTQTMLNIT
jgi:hypothetical protein